MEIENKINKYNMFACYEVVTAMENKTWESVSSMGIEFEGGA